MSIQTEITSMLSIVVFIQYVSTVVPPSSKGVSKICKIISFSYKKTKNCF